MAKANQNPAAAQAKSNGFVAFIKRLNPAVWGKRLWRFIREVYAELKKVVWPTKSTLINYTIAVLVFVAIFGVITFGMDTGLSALVNLLWK